MNIVDEIIFQYPIQRYIGNTNQSSATLLRVVPLHKTNTSVKYKIIWSSLEFNLRNYKCNQISSYLNINGGIIILYSYLRCFGNTI